MSQKPVIVWFGNDLRLADHPALAAATASGAPVVPVYVLDDVTPGPWAPGGASRWWLHHSLAALGADLAGRGSRLILRHGAAVDEIVALARAIDASGVYLTRRYEPFARAAEAALAEQLSRQGIDCRRFGGTLLFEPEVITTGTGRPYRVFTPFRTACRAAMAPSTPLAIPPRIAAPATWPTSDSLSDWNLTPAAPDWAGGLREAWTPGEAGAEGRLAAFLDGVLGDYDVLRDWPGRPGTSRLSPHLRHGEISPRAVWHQVRFAAESAGKPEIADGFLREVIWREFSYHLLYHFPHITDMPLRSAFADFPWSGDDRALKPWQHGETGYPIVDAAMRELWQTGWMHNRTRMIVASFLVKDLLVPWQKGAAWFWDTLVDADLANNAANWQWVAGCGTDAAPYFRIFNPVLQGRKFDPDGAYVRHFIPEIEKLSNDDIHAPWKASAEALSAAGIQLGKTYPVPMVDHAEARARALAAYKTIA